MMPVLCVVVMPNFSSLENGIVMIVLPRQKKYIEVELAREGIMLTARKISVGDCEQI